MWKAFEAQSVGIPTRYLSSTELISYSFVKWKCRLTPFKICSWEKQFFKMKTGHFSTITLCINIKDAY